MKKISLRVLGISLLVALGITIYGLVQGKTSTIDAVAGMQALPMGQTVVARYQNDSIVLDRVKIDGRSNGTISIKRKTGKSFYSLVDMSADANGNIYLLMDIKDTKTGKYQKQELSIFNIDKLFSKHLKTYELDTKDGKHYRFIDALGQVVLMATDANEETLYREALDAENLLNGKGFLSKGTRTYKLQAKDGIDHAVTVGANVAYRSRSGKVFLATEKKEPLELYSALKLQEATYPIFIAPESSEKIIMGVQESGDFLSMSLPDGTTEVIKGGREPFSGISSYTPLDVVSMSMLNRQNFTAVTAKKTGFDLVVNFNGNATVIEKISPALISSIGKFIGKLLGWFIIIGIAGQLVCLLVYLIGSSRTILIKLLAASIPLLALALTFFGVFSFNTYSNSISQSFEKQVADEGSLLRALFGTESFAQIEFPYQYTSDSYNYLKQNMNTRTVHTATAYYERQKLFVGVDNSYPCAYPFDIKLNFKAAELYREAAFTGHTQTGIINDAEGERIACITPIGGVSGSVVYLLETGIPIADMREYTNSYLRNYIIVALAFVTVIAVVITLVFRRILAPIGAIKIGLEEFSRGNRTVRLMDNASDELSDIIRVFNKMANDIDAQIFSLRQASETYFRFIPQQMLQLLGKDNLGDIELGSSMERDCSMLCISLLLKGNNLTREEEQSLTNRFFNIINKACDQNKATLLPDGVGLRKLRVLCNGGAESAVNLSLYAMSQLDAVNAKLPVQNRLDTLFVVHRAPNYYGICGDENRLVPALISSEMDMIANSEKALRALKSRLIVTQPAFKEIEPQKYACRYIGHLEEQGLEQIGLYDFYDGAPPKETRLISETLATFDKAVALYEQGRYYDAKGLFALVLRQNQYDNVARYYVFSAEGKI
ncbi:MAG: HAMP domain-containing protein [Oscillospiraceae bacterium]